MWLEDFLWKSLEYVARTFRYITNACVVIGSAYEIAILHENAYSRLVNRN